MTAITIAMLGSVLLATAVLAFVGILHELTRSARGRRWLRRRRYAMQVRSEALRDLTDYGLRTGRRALAGQLSRPAPVHVPQTTAQVSRPPVGVPQRLATR